MAFENIQIEYPNFCLTPQLGTFATINTSEATTRLRIKGEAGGLIGDYTLSSNIHPDNELIGIEYCGPLNVGGIIDDVTFFTVERVSSSQCLIKRWETNITFSLLNLKQQIVKYTSGNFYYDVTGAAVEHYHRTFDFAQPSGQSYLDISSASRIQSGDTLFLGPSSDTDNIGATENVSVSHVSGNRVFLNSSTVYQYVFGNQITFFNNIYLISSKGYAGDSRYGTVFKHDAYSGARLEYTTGGEYKHITGAKWSIEVDAIAGINTSQLLFIRPYDSYLKWKSMFLTNIEDNNKDYFEVYDIVFDEFTIYKLMMKLTLKDDSGDKTTYSWSTYNYQQDTLVPYTHNVAIYMLQQYTIGPDGTRIYVQTRDQFGVGLRDVNINLYDDGSDGDAEFTPLGGNVITDINGEADVGYTPGGLYTGPTIISVKADKSSPASTGSQFCWNSILIDGRTELVDQFGRGSMFQDKEHSGFVSGRQANDSFKNKEGVLPPIYLICYSYFGQPGGNWVAGGDYSYGCWPWFEVTGGRQDGPSSTIANVGCKWDCITWEPAAGEPVTDSCTTEPVRQPRADFITQVLEFTQVGVPPKYYQGQGSLDDDSKSLIIPQRTWFWQYYKDVSCVGGCELGDGKPPRILGFQIDSKNELGFSQLNLSRHSNWEDGEYTADLRTHVHLDQFIFVEDAVPSFWSEKNPRETDIWIRLRPFAFSLDGMTMKFFVREVWTVDDVHYDTGYYDVIERYGWPPDNDRVTLDYFDAGGGVQGIEFTYDAPDIYHHNALIYVHIELYDTSAEPNFIYTDYWFRIIPDYNSPYLLNESPDREEDQVSLDTTLYFEIKDAGEGIDIDTLEVFLNSRTVYHAEHTPDPKTVIEKVSLNHYKVTIGLPYELQYGKDYSVGVTVKDISENKNVLRDSYRFYTRQSEVPWFTDFDPKLCKRGMPRFRDVSFVVLGGGEGVDEQTIRIQVHDKDITDKSTMTPVVYRVS